MDPSDADVTLARCCIKLKLTSTKPQVQDTPKPPKKKKQNTVQCDDIEGLTTMGDQRAVVHPDVQDSAPMAKVTPTKGKHKAGKDAADIG